MLIEKMGLPHDALAGKMAVVTGAGRGIGKELARALAWLGARVVIAEVAETGAEVEALIRSEGGTALFVQTDVGDEESIRALADRAFAAFGRVDILVNNAIIYRTGAILEVPIEVWDQVYAVNLRGAVVAIQTFLPAMLERKEGVIVTITSQEGMPYAAPYFASKAALRSLGLSLAAELGEDSGVYARRDFQRTSGLSINDWLEEATNLVSELETLAETAQTGETGEIHRIRARLPWLRGNLEKLAGYFQKTAKDAEGFIQDPQALSAALEALARREQTVRALVSVLEQVGQTELG